jgi:hypothetical protein
VAGRGLLEKAAAAVGGRGGLCAGAGGRRGRVDGCFGGCGVLGGGSTWRSGCGGGWGIGVGGAGGTAALVRVLVGGVGGHVENWKMYHLAISSSSD